MWYASNRAESFATALAPGIYGLSNELLDTPWPKLQRVRRRFDSLVTQADAVSKNDLLAMLADTTRAALDEQLPRAGLSPEWERMLSSPFIRNERYGTRCSTLILLEHSGAVSLTERRFDPKGAVIGDTEVTLEAGEWL